MKSGVEHGVLAGTKPQSNKNPPNIIITKSVRKKHIFIKLFLRTDANLSIVNPSGYNRGDIPWQESNTKSEDLRKSKILSVVVI